MSDEKKSDSQKQTENEPTLDPSKRDTANPTDVRPQDMEQAVLNGISGGL